MDNNDMNKRRTCDDQANQMFPNPKHIKLSESGCADLLNGIDFVDFDDEFTSSEENSEEQQPSTSIKRDNSVENLLHGIDFDSFDECDTSQPEHLLDVSTWKRCIIDDCSRDARTHDLIIAGHEEQKTENAKRMICRLQHFWSQCRIEVGDIVSIIAVWNAKTRSYCVSNNDGFVVVRPDFLVSGTTVVGGLFCMRKAVLQDRFKGIEAGAKIVSHTHPFFSHNSNMK